MEGDSPISLRENWEGPQVVFRLPLIPQNHQRSNGPPLVWEISQAVFRTARSSRNWYEVGTGGLSPVSNGRDAFSIGVGVNLPIYRQRLNAAVQEAENKFCTTARRYDAVRDRFRTEIAVLSAQFREHHRTLAILESDILPRADETLKLALESYREALKRLQDVNSGLRTLHADALPSDLEETFDRRAYNRSILDLRRHYRLERIETTFKAAKILAMTGKKRQAVLDLRRELYYGHNNLLGLLYALYVDGDTQVVPGLQLKE